MDKKEFQNWVSQEVTRLYNRKMQLEQVRNRENGSLTGWIFDFDAKAGQLWQKQLEAEVELGEYLISRV